MPLTSKSKGSNPKKSAQRSAPTLTPRAAAYRDFENETKARLAYFATQKEIAAKQNPKMLAKFELREKEYRETRSIQADLKFSQSPLIANNVIFGKIDGEEPRYGFTCILTKDGHTEVIPVPDTGDRTLSDAKEMVDSGMLVLAYKKLSRAYLDDARRRDQEEKKLRDQEARAAALEEARMALAYAARL